MRGWKGWKSSSWTGWGRYVAILKNISSIAVKMPSRFINKLKVKGFK